MTSRVLPSTSSVLRDLFGIEPETPDEIESLHPIEQAAIERQHLNFSDDEEDDLNVEDDGFGHLFEDESEETHEHLPPPPDDLEWESFDDLWAYVLNWSCDHGYGIRIGTGAKYKPKGERYRVYIECDKAESPSTKATSRDSASRGIKCPFRMCAQRHDSRNKIWTLRHMVDHSNHPASLDPAAHPCHRKLSDDDMAFIETQSISGIPPKLIAESLEKRGSKAKVSDVYNARYRLRSQRLQGLTPIQALFALLEHDQTGWHCRSTKDSFGRITKLFFVHQKQIMLARTYPELVFTDATYKTNRFKMPLIHFMGVVPVSKRRKNTTGSNLSTGFCFVNEETEETWTWAVQQFKDLVMYEDIDGFTPTPEVWIRDGDPKIGTGINAVYPEATQLLCLYHINQNVLTHINLTWRLHADLTDEEAQQVRDDRKAVLRNWWSVISSTTEEEWRRRLDYMYEEYKAYPKFVDYLKESQEPLRKMTVKFWTSQWQHFGNTATSRLEGGHHTIKAFLHGSFGDLLDVVQRIKLHIDREYRELRTALAIAITRFPASVNPAKVKVFTEDLTSTIMPLGLKLALRQYNYAVGRDYNAQCNGRWQRIYGMPCCHVMHRYLNSEHQGVIPTLFTQDFASRWSVARMKKLFQMRKPRDERNPHQAKSVGRPKGAPNRRQQGTRTSSSRMLPQGTDPRDLSRSEHTHRNPVPESHRREASLERARLEAANHREWQASRHQSQHHHDGQVTTPEPTQDLGFDGPPPPPLPSDDATGPANDATEASRKRARAATVQSTLQSAPAALQSTSVAASKKRRGRPPLTPAQKAENARKRKIKTLETSLAALRAGPSD